MGDEIHSELYEFRLRGELSEVTLIAFANFRATIRDGETILSGEVPDQAALFGVLDRIEALGIPLIAVGPRQQASRRGPRR